MNGPQTKTIDGMSVTCVPLDGWDGWALLPEIAKIAAPLLAQIKGKGNINLLDMDLDLERLLREAGASLDGDKLPELMVRLMRQTVVVIPGPNGSNGSMKHDIRDRSTFNLAFSGPTFWSAFKVAAFAFRVTFGDFSSALGQLAAAQPAP